MICVAVIAGVLSHRKPLLAARIAARPPVRGDNYEIDSSRRHGHRRCQLWAAAVVLARSWARSSLWQILQPLGAAGTSPHSSRGESLLLRGPDTSQVMVLTTQAVHSGWQRTAHS